MEKIYGTVLRKASNLVMLLIKSIFVLLKAIIKIPSFDNVSRMHDRIFRESKMLKVETRIIVTIQSKLGFKKKITVTIPVILF